MTTTQFRYAGWHSTSRTRGEVVWVESFEAVDHFHKKDALVADMQALRTLESLAVKADINSATQNALDYIQSEMIKINKKIISANRKAEREGWYCISDYQMQKAIAIHLIQKNEGKAA